MHPDDLFVMSQGITPRNIFQAVQSDSIDNAVENQLLAAQGQTEDTNSTPQHSPGSVAQPQLIDTVSVIPSDSIDKVVENQLLAAQGQAEDTNSTIQRSPGSEAQPQLIDTVSVIPSYSIDNVVENQLLATQGQAEDAFAALESLPGSESIGNSGCEMDSFYSDAVSSEWIGTGDYEQNQQISPTVSATNVQLERSVNDYRQQQNTPRPRFQLANGSTDMQSDAIHKRTRGSLQRALGYQNPPATRSRDKKSKSGIFKRKSLNKDVAYTESGESGESGESSTDSGYNSRRSSLRGSSGSEHEPSGPALRKRCKPDKSMPALRSGPLQHAWPALQTPDFNVLTGGNPTYASAFLRNEVFTLHGALSDQKLQTIKWNSGTNLSIHGTPFVLRHVKLSREDLAIMMDAERAFPVQGVKAYISLLNLRDELQISSQRKAKFLLVDPNASFTFLQADKGVVPKREKLLLKFIKDHSTPDSDTTHIFFPLNKYVKESPSDFAWWGALIDIEAATIHVIKTTGMTSESLDSICRLRTFFERNWNDIYPDIESPSFEINILATQPSTDDISWLDSGVYICVLMDLLYTGLAFDQINGFITKNNIPFIRQEICKFMQGFKHAPGMFMNDSIISILV